MRSLGVQLCTVLMTSLLLTGCGSNQHDNVGNIRNNEEAAVLDEGGLVMSEAGSTIKGEQIGEALLNGEYEALYQQFGEGLSSIVNQDDFAALAKDFLADVDQLLLTSSMHVNGFYHYVWQDASDSKATKGVLAVVDEHDRIEGFQVLPLTTYPEMDDQYSQTEYQLPFSGEWLVFWGGKSAMLNYHYEYEHMRYAYDFIGVQDGYSFSGDPLSNDSYYAFGREVLAPASGTVVNVIDGIEDNIPGEMNEEQPLGNAIIIQHDNGEYSMLAHFKKDSIVVKVGDEVVAGQLLGECGNSGNSSEAHIHFQVYKLNDSGAEQVLPVSFVDGKEWIRGDLAVGK